MRAFAVTPLVLALLIVASVATFRAAAEDGGFKPIFNGKDLSGWSAPDMTYWSVRDGAITAESTPQKPCKKNQFLVWQLGELDDFELKLKFKISGSKSANAGVQFRSAIQKDGHAVGYQADIDLAGKWLGALYDELTGRKMLAKRGQVVEIDTTGQRTINPGKPNPGS
ncbi:MAG: DUF1080 domain-containing protein, partial [Phycisphaeraceae bacterium]|nr:DUF1080 domain-containing protein [Phycisphaeraceae bacterium]